MKEKACRRCHLLLPPGSKCSNCGGDDLSSDWEGLAIILDPELSMVAKKLGITKSGRYALVVR